MMVVNVFLVDVGTGKCLRYGEQEPLQVDLHVEDSSQTDQMIASILDVFRQRHIRSHSTMQNTQ